MKRFLSTLLLIAVAVSLLAACEKPLDPAEEEHKYGKIIYVSPDGNDENSGEKDTPVASLSGAVKALRTYRTENGLPEGGIKIEFVEGTYNVTESITLTADDSGEEDKPIVFASAKDAYVLFDGGVSINPSDFKPADDTFKSLLPTEEAKANVLMLDLAAAGCYDLDDAVNNQANNFYRQELFVNGKRQDVARWPNKEYYHPEVDYKNLISDESGNKFGKIFITEEQADVWRNIKDIRFYGYPYYDWRTVRMNKIDVSADEAALLYPVTGESSLGKGCVYFVYNIPQELDSPGEYYWDTKSNILYYWPDTGFETSEISFSQFTEYPVTLEKCSYITFDNLSAKYFRNGFLNGIGNHITVSNCCLSGLGGNAAVSLIGDYNTIKGCLLHDLAAKGITVRAGDVATQTFGNTTVIDNIIYEWQQIYTVYNAAIDINGYGILVSHNEMHDSPHVAVEVSGGQCVIEYNLIYNCCRESSDCGAVHTLGYFTWYDNVYRYNVMHDVKDLVHEPGWGNGVYFDCWGRFWSAYGNLFYNIAGTALCGASGYMDLHDNICVNVGGPINIVYWGTEEMPDFYDNESWMKNDIRLYDYHSQLWRYTSSRTLLFAEVGNQDENYTSYDLPQSPSHFYIRNNVRYIDSSSPFEPFDDDEGEDPSLFRIVRGMPWAFDLSAISDNVYYLEDPGFTDYANNDFTFRKDSRVFRDLIGFEEPDLSTVGARASENPFK